MTELNREAIRVTIDNSAGWVITTNTGAASNIVQIASGTALIGTINTIAIGAGGTVTVVNSGGLYAQQSGPWVVGITNSAGWVFAQSNTGGAFTLSNSSALASIITNSQNWVIYVQQSGNWNISNTGGSFTLLNSSAISFVNSTINLINTSGWAIFNLDSAAIGSVVTQVASTIGATTLAVSNTKRVALSIYNASVNPLFMKLGNAASTASYTLMMVASGYYELARPIYNGIITGIWQTANGNAYVSETT